ncbi:Trans-aconitate 2-methyltransferase [Candidatus Vallotia cooleyia]|nr:Trans-aconitate 2-methyltransferase [Candidatus Vallotia cooleyia]
MLTNHDQSAGQHTQVAYSAPRLRQIRQVFDRRAAKFCDVAFLPREIAQRMYKRLQYINLQPDQVLDAGCGSGEDIDLLRARYAQATIYGVDLSRAMLCAKYSSGCGNANIATGWRRLLPAAVLRYLARSCVQMSYRVQADFSALPFAPERFDLLWSNLALHWHVQPDLVLTEWKRVLKTGGILMFSALGPDTLRELRSAKSAVDSSIVQYMLDFIDMHDCGDMLVASGFEISVMDMETLTVMYSSPKALLADVRRWGVIPSQATKNANVSHVPISRGIYHRLLNALEAQRTPNGMIPLTFEIVYGHAQKAVAQMTPEGYGLVRVNEISHNWRATRRMSS